MSKMRVLLVGATAAGAFAAASFIPAHAVDTPIGSANADTGGIYLDGAATNPDPLDGYLTITAAGVCGADNGSPSNHQAGTENCNEDLGS